MILVTGGAGFIGSNFILDWIAASGEAVVNLDKLTYAGNLENLASLKDDSRHVFAQGDINDRKLLAKLLSQHQPRAIIHFAAESHSELETQWLIYGHELAQDFRAAAQKGDGAAGAALPAWDASLTLCMEA